MGKKSRSKRNLINGYRSEKHRANAAWARINNARHYGVFAQRKDVQTAAIRDGKAVLVNARAPDITGFVEYNKQMQARGFGTPSSHYAHRLVWQDGKVVGFRHRTRPSPERRALHRTLPRGKAVMRLIALERGGWV